MYFKPQTSKAKSTAHAGQIIVEAVVALSVLTFGFLGIMTLLSQSTSLSRTASDSYTATYLAAEGIEIVKNLLDANIIRGKTENDWADGFKTRGRPAQAFEVQYDDTRPNDFREIYGNRQYRFLRFDPVNRVYSYDGGTETLFRRNVGIFFPGFADPSQVGDEMRVTSRVWWTGRGGSEHSVQLDDIFYNWRPGGGP